MDLAERFKGANTIDAGRLSPYWGEHAARYTFALQFVLGCTVLDLACGTGYGAAMMSRTARSVTGVDVDIDAVREAKSECDGKAAVLLGDGLCLPFADGRFDVITSFETLEHLQERPAFLAELRRVLSPDGVLVLSTPNANFTLPVGGKPANPFHIFEYTPDELRAELNASFQIDRLMGQALRGDFGIPPFYDAQRRLPNDLGTRSRLFGWKALNKLPVMARDGVSKLLWKRPFYPTPGDYVFSEEIVKNAPVLVAVCRPK